MIWYDWALLSLVYNIKSNFVFLIVYVFVNNVLLYDGTDPFNKILKYLTYKYSFTLLT
jgi:hypothetical protein